MVSAVQTDVTRRGVLAATIVAGVLGISISEAGDLFEQFAPLSGSAWRAAGRERPDSLESPHGPATVTIDAEGVPHVEAEDERGAYYAVGYQHGYDRLFQLDLQRRQMRGELSAVVGDVTLESDEFHARMDFPEAARSTWEGVRETHLGPLVEAYAEGVNAAIDDHPLPLEFELLEFEPEPWTPTDCFLMEKQISWSLTGNFRALRRAVARDQLEEPVFEGLFPERMDHDVPILRIDHDHAELLGEVRGVAADGADGDPENASDGNDSNESTDARSALADWLTSFESTPGVGSNSWVVSGDHTDAGTPILANDPHLELLTPPIWYEQRVRTPETDVRGVTFPGVPFVIIGANQTTAWGVTNVGADVLDCYTYEFDDEDRYRYREEWRELETEAHEIEVSGGENRTITRRRTVHGPLLEREDERVGVAWTGLTATRTIQAVYDLGRAEGVEAAVEATRQFDAPTQNLVVADADGGTAYVVTGRIPIRRIDGEVVDGNRLFDGSAGEGEWDGYTPYGDSDWSGFVPFEEKPHALNPDVLATANQRVADDPDHYLGVAYAEPYRGQRIYDVLDDTLEGTTAGDTDLEFHRALQTDTRDERADHLLATLLEAVDQSEAAHEGRESLEDAVETLSSWSQHMDRDEPGALLFARWLEHYREWVLEPLFKGTSLDESYAPNDWIVAELEPGSPVFEAHERSRAELMVEALRDTLEERDAEGWDGYGDWNTTSPISHPFGAEAPFLNYESRAADGSRATVNNYRVESAVGASWRMVSQPGGEAWGIVPGGNSGDYFDEQYDTQFGRWVDGEYKPMPLETPAPVDAFHVVTFTEVDDA